MSEESITDNRISQVSEETTDSSASRRMNYVWEITQALIAVSVTAAIIYTSMKGLTNQELSNAFFLIIGFYFSRTSHASRSHRVTDYK